MLTKEDLIKLRQTYIECASNVLKTRLKDDEDVNDILNMIEELGFYSSPASTKYYCSFEGGLMLRALDVYDTMMTLNDACSLNIDRDSIAIVALFGELGKSVMYEKTFSNKKVYSENGSKYDEQGRYDWVSVPGYKTVEYDERVSSLDFKGKPSFESFKFLNNWMEFKLTDDEQAAILFQDITTEDKDYYNVMNSNELLVLLNTARMLNTFILERHE